MFIFSPLEQFEFFTNLYVIVKGTTLARDYWLISNIDITFLLFFFIVFVIIGWMAQTRFFFPNFSFVLGDFFFVTLLGMLFSMVGHGRAERKSINILFCLFFFILFLNLLGLVPFGFCVTSQLIITQFLGVFAIAGLTLKGIQVLGFKFLNLFVPRNVPLVMLPFLSLIEFVSYISRMLSLSIRLFANMVAGHALLHILMGALLSIFSFSFLSVFVFIFFFIPMLLIFAIMLLEMGIAFLQAYVFVVLFLIYMNDSYKSH